MLSQSRNLFFILGFLLAPALTLAPCTSSPTIHFSLGNCTIPSPNREDVYSWGIRMSIDGVDDLCVVPSTVVTHSFLTTEALCSGEELKDAEGVTMTPARCRSRRGGFISQLQSLPSAPTDGLDSTNPNWRALGNEISAAALATLKVFDERVAMVVGLITTGQQSTASHLGLASGSAFLRTLKDRGLIAARSFGLNAGSQSVEFPRRGSLVLGGYDRASFGSSAAVEYNISTDKLNNRLCPLRVQVEGLSLTAGNDTDRRTETLIGLGNAFDFCIEPYDNLFRLPNNTLDQLRRFFASVTQHQDPPVPPNEYQHKIANLEPGLVYPRSAALSFNGSMRIILKGGFTVDIPVHEMQRPLRGLDQEGMPVLDQDFTELQVYGREAPGFAPVLGKAFLSQVYLFVDEESGIFRLAPQALEVASPVPVSSLTCTPGLSLSDKGLIVVGSVLGFLIVCLVAHALYRLYRRFRPVADTGEEAAEPSVPAPTPPGVQNPVMSGMGPEENSQHTPSRPTSPRRSSNLSSTVDDPVWRPAANHMREMRGERFAGLPSFPSEGLPPAGGSSPGSRETRVVGVSIF
ncbi:hypothetical protein N657DRAFT_650550 [Parathielavia appendiculata]|uniref:Peptidase A1 domain-containing protein n=1 Tax=Parathielavia appendiculata TaxID=2587402 RepID=A0AAN6TSA1_9PEZI|nr:hypothetical protein N657DRAFT_650550 [Parathielavia appendiculata]